MQKLYSRKKLIEAYNEEGKKEQSKWLKKQRKREEEQTDKTCIDPKLSLQFDKKISIAKDVAESRKLLKQEYEKQKYGEIYREIEREKQCKPIVKSLQDLVAKTMSYQESMKAIKEPLEPPPKPPEEHLKAIEQPLWNKDEMKEMGDLLLNI